MSIKHLKTRPRGSLKLSQPREREAASFSQQREFTPVATVLDVFDLITTAKAMVEGITLLTTDAMVA